MTDRSMASTDGEMPPLQAETFAKVPDRWIEVPRIGVHEMILRALVVRGVVETRWHNGIRQWRRAP